MDVISQSVDKGVVKRRLDLKAENEACRSFFNRRLG